MDRVKVNKSVSFNGVLLETLVECTARLVQFFVAVSFQTTNV